jgi:hypothetical protein
MLMNSTTHKVLFGTSIEDALKAEENRKKALGQGHAKRDALEDVVLSGKKPFTHEYSRELDTSKVVEIVP